jgi:hypothetical protein
MITLVGWLVGVQAAAAQWSIQSIPNPPGGGELRGVSCLSSSSCVAVGLRFGGYGHGPDTGLVESWNGTKWTLEPAPKPTGASFDGVSCVSSKSCTAVGSNLTHTENALVETWNGQRWKAQPNPASAGPYSLLLGVSCVSKSSCTAVGYVTKHGRGSRALVEHWDGAGWKPQSNPASARRGSRLTGVSCVSRSFCTAVGRVGHDALVESWNGRSWKIQSNPGANAACGACHVLPPPGVPRSAV